MIRSVDIQLEQMIKNLHEYLRILQLAPFAPCGRKMLMFRIGSVRGCVERSELID